MEQGTIIFDPSAKNQSGGYIIGKIDYTASELADSAGLAVTLKLYCKKANDSLQLTVATSGIWNYSLYIGDHIVTDRTPSDTKILCDWVKLGETTLHLPFSQSSVQAVMIGGSVASPAGSSYEGLQSAGEMAVFLGVEGRLGRILGAKNMTFGESTAIYFEVNSPYLYHRFCCNIGEKEHWFPMLSPCATGTYSRLLTLPYTLLEELTDSAAGKMTLTLETYADADGIFVLGQDCAEVTVNVPDSPETAPEVSFVITPDNAALPSLFADLFIAGETRVRGEISAKGKYGASVKETWLLAENKVYYGSSLRSDPLYLSGSITLCAYAKDSRGIVGKSELTVTVHPYRPPKAAPLAGADKVLCCRCDEYGNPTPEGRSLLVEAEASYSSLAGRNSARMTLGIGDHTAEMPNGRLILEDALPSLAQAYTVYLTASDLLGKESTLVLTVPTGKTDFHLGYGGNKAAFGKFATKENALEIAEDWTLFLGEDPLLDFVCKAGCENGWYYRIFHSGRAELYGSFTITPAEGEPLGALYLSSPISLPLPFSLDSPLAFCQNGRAEVQNDTLTLQLLSPIPYTSAAPLRTDIVLCGQYREF